MSSKSNSSGATRGDAARPSNDALVSVLDPVIDFASKMKFMSLCGGDPFRAWEKIESFIEEGHRSGGGADPFAFALCRNKRLEQALAGSSAHFCYEGTAGDYWGWNFKKSWEALLQNSRSLLSNQELSDANDTLTIGGLPVSALIKIASPAPFGRAGETVFDKDVRNALEIPSDRMPEELISKLTSLVGRSRKWEEVMKPYRKIWTYKLYNIHMYGPGGKFDKHVDTLHGENHVATLVVCLPSLHKGGKLRIQHLDKKVSILHVDRYSRRGLKCAAFFTDCTHEVEEVTEGWRIVAQFDIYEEDQPQEIEKDDDSENNDGGESLRQWASEMMEESGVLVSPKTVRSDSSFQQVVNALEDVLVSERTCPDSDEQAAVGFFLRHRYSLPSLEMNKLKGADRIMFDVMEAKGYQVYFSAVILRFYKVYDSNIIESAEVFTICMEDFYDTEDKSSAVDEEGVKKKKIINVGLVFDPAMANAEFLREPVVGETGHRPWGGYQVYRSACMIVVEKDTSSLDGKVKSENDRKQAAKPVPAAFPGSATDGDSKTSASEPTVSVSSTQDASKVLLQNNPDSRDNEATAVWTYKSMSSAISGGDMAGAMADSIAASPMATWTEGKTEEAGDEAAAPQATSPTAFKLEAVGNASALAEEAAPIANGDALGGKAAAAPGSESTQVDEEQLAKKLKMDTAVDEVWGNEEK